MTSTSSAIPPRYGRIDLTPTENMVREANRGLGWWREHDGRGGNEMALARAWGIRRRTPMRPDAVRRMALHMSKLLTREGSQGWNEGHPDYPSPSRVQWALLGGDAGYAWAQAVVGGLDAADAAMTANQAAGQLLTAEVTTRTPDDKPYVVAPVVALVPGVVNGFLVTADELAASADAWNGRPVTLRHPQAGNRYVSADNPAVAARQQIGVLRNVAFTDGKLRGEIWLDPALCAGVGDEALAVLHALREGQPFEVSTGYYCAVRDHAGVWDGHPFDGEQCALEPDHLALLPDEIGACSWADGCGAPRVNVTDAPPDYSDHAMVAFYLREQAAPFASHIEGWPEGSRALDPAEYHITLAYLGRISELPPGVEYGRVAAAVGEFARHQPTVFGAVSGVGRFSTEDGVEPVYLSVDSAPLQAMRAELAAFLEATGVPVRREHGFTPHITLGYAPGGAPVALHPPPPSRLVIDALALAWGGDVTVFPLQGDAYPSPAAGPVTNACACGEGTADDGRTPARTGEDKEMTEEMQVQDEAADAMATDMGEAEGGGTAAPVGAGPSAADELVAAFGGVEAVRAMLEQFQANVRAEQDELVHRLMGNARCAFGEDELRGLSPDVLRKLDASLRPADYSLRQMTDNRTERGVTLYGQTWVPYEAPAAVSR